MTWNDITVEHYQTIYPYMKQEPANDLEALSRDCKILEILTGKSEAQIDRLPLKEFAELRRSISFLHNQDIPAHPAKYLKCANGRTYKICYDVRRAQIARYVEIKHFASTPEAQLENLHYIMASMVIPVRRNKTRTGWKELPYDASKHMEYANDIKSARFQDVYYSMVFFCNLYANWMRNSRDYLVQRTMNQTKMNRLEAETLVHTFISDMDGFIISNRLPIIRTSLNQKPGKSQPSKR